MKRHTVIALAAAAVAAGTAAWFVDRHGRAPASSGAETPATLFPELKSRINDVASITIKNGANVFTVSLKDGAWGLDAKAGYPVNVDHVKSAAVGLAELEPVEKKTSRPELYGKIGVQNPEEVPPSVPDSTAGAQPPLAVTIKDAKDVVLAAAIVGNQKWGAKPEVYIRKTDDTQSWLAVGRLDIPREPLGWVERQIMDLARERPKSATITHPDGTTVSVSKNAKTNANFTIHGVPEGREPSSQYAGDAIGTILSYLSMDDVVPASSIDFAGEGVTAGTTTVVKAFDGLVITATTATKDGKTWAKFVASFEEPPAPTPPDPSQPTDAAPAPPEGKSADEVRKEVETLNMRLSPWVFAIPDYKSKTFSTRLDELLKPLPEPTVNQDPTQPPPDLGDSILAPPK